jgi:hypothetical protein
MRSTIQKPAKSKHHSPIDKFLYDAPTFGTLDIDKAVKKRKRKSKS